MFLGFAPIGRNVRLNRSGNDESTTQDRLSNLRDALAAVVEGHWDDDEALLNADRDIAKTDAAILNLLGIVHQAKGQWKEARRYYGKAMKTDRTYAPAE